LIRKRKKKGNVEAPTGHSKGEEKKKKRTLDNTISNQLLGKQDQKGKKREKKNPTYLGKEDEKGGEKKRWARNTQMIFVAP